jgi:ligand-binding sensor domain-containing protein/signal transduction histidine kinase
MAFRQGFICIIIGLALCTPLPGLGQGELRYSVRYLGANEGLTNRNITKLFQTRDGLLWIGTLNGLFMFDGIKVECFDQKPQSRIRIAGSRVRSIVEDQQNNLWVCADQGLVVIDPQRRQVLPGRSVGLPDSICSQKECSVVVRQDGTLILCAANHFYKYQGGVLRNWFSADPHGYNTPTWLICSAPGDAVYVKNIENELFLADQSGFHSRDYPVKGSKEASGAMKPLHFYWFNALNGFSDSTLFYLTENRVLEPGSHLGKPCYNIRENGGLQARIPAWEAVLDFGNQPDLPFEKSILDHLGLLDILHAPLDYWIIGTNYGVFLVSERKQYFRKIPCTEGKSIRGMVEDADHNLLISSYQGMLYVNPFRNKGEALDQSGFSWKFIPIGKDSFRVCGETKGTRLFYRNASHRYVYSNSEFAHELTNSRSMANTPHGIWIGPTVNQLFFLPASGAKPEPSPFNHSEWVQRNASQVRNIAQNQCVKSICYAPESGLWVGGDGQLHHFLLDQETDRITQDLSAQLPVPLQQTPVNVIYKNKDGILFIGTYKDGLYALDPTKNSLRHWTVENGLCNNIIYSMLGSNSDSILWLGTQYGLSRMDVASETFSNFYTQDGLPQNEFNTAAQLKSADGTLYMGGLNGVTYFRPEWIPETGVNLKAWIKADLIDLVTQKNRHLLLHDGALLQVNPDERYLEIQCGTNDLFDAKNIGFRYKIEGLHGVWNYAHSLDKITLTGLPPGEYQFIFQVQAVNGPWSQPDRIRLWLLPHWYATWQFRLLLFLSVAALLYAVYRLRIRQITNEFKIRQKVSHDLHDEIGNRLYAMKMLASKLVHPKTTNDERLTLSSQFEHLSKTTLAHTRDFIWALDPRHDDLDSFIDRLEDFTNGTIRPIVPGLEFRRKSDWGKISFPTLSRHDNMLLYQEIMTNLVKHTKTQKIIVDFWIISQNLHVRIVNRHLGIVTSDHTSSTHSSGLESIDNRLKASNTELLSTFEENTQTFELVIKLT